MISSSVTALLFVIAAAAIVVTPDRAPVLLLIGAGGAIIPLRHAWHEAGGTAMRPALIWMALALGAAMVAQVFALVEPLAAGRPLAGRFTYLAVLAVLAALISILNARTPGERVWAILMFLLVVVFLIPWLEESGRMRRAQGASLVHLESPWTIFYGLLAAVGVTNYLPTRYSAAAACLGAGLVVEYLGLTATNWPPARQAMAWEWVVWTVVASLWLARQSRVHVRTLTPFDAVWLWFRDHWGVVWALRTQERFNRTAELAGWNVRLTWFGLMAVTQANDAAPLPSSAEAEAMLQSLLRRFATPEKLAEVTRFHGASSCDGERRRRKMMQSFFVKTR